MHPWQEYLLQSMHERERALEEDTKETIEIHKYIPQKIL